MVCLPGITNLPGHSSPVVFAPDDACTLTRRTLYMQCRYALGHHYPVGFGLAGLMTPGPPAAPGV